MHVATNDSSVPLLFFLFLSFFPVSMRLFSCSHEILGLRIKMEATHRSLQVAAGSNIQSDLKHEARKQASWAVGTSEFFFTFTLEVK